jgi:hypothetical protein
MNQEIVTFIQNYPVIFIILCTAAGFAGGFAFYPWITWILAPRTRRSMVGQSVKKPEPSDGEKAAFRSMMIGTSWREKEHVERLKELQKKEDEAKNDLLIISNEELADKLRDSSILSVELINAMRNEALARMIDPSSSEIEEYLQSQHEKIPLEEAACKMQSESGEAYRSNLAELPKIDLYNLPDASKHTLEDVEALAIRIVRKWYDSPENKRPAVLRVKLNTIGGQRLSRILKRNGILVEPKIKP